MTLNTITFTRFTSANSNLSKRFFVHDGVLRKEAAAQMTRGKAERLRMPFAEFAQTLESATAMQAFGYGIYADNFPDEVSIAIRGRTRPDENIISRSKEFFQYQGSGVMMIDHDPSPYGPTMAPGALLDALASVHAEITQAACIVRGSVSAGVNLAGNPPRINKGFHIYFPVSDTSKLPEYGALLADRLWLAGFGFIALAKNGAMLERTIIDTSVFSPERLDFVGKPILIGEDITYTPPNLEKFDGTMLDAGTLEPLTPIESKQVAALKKAAKSAMLDASAKQGEIWRGGKIAEMVANGVPLTQANEAIQRLSESGARDLYGEYVLEFSCIGVATVEEVLANPERFDGKALADPIEGIDYGATTAKFYWNDGKPVINSFAHGQNMKYFLHSMDFGVLAASMAPAKFKAPLLALDARDGTNTTRALSELGNAYRLSDTHSENLRYCPEVKAWLHWHDSGWCWDLDGARTRSLAADLHQLIYAEGLLHPTECELFAKWARMSQKENTIENAVSLLRDFEAMRVPIAFIDANAMLAGLDGGRTVLDLTTGTTRLAKQSDYVTKSLAVTHLGDSSRAVRWESFLGQVFGGDEELIKWLQRWCGYLLSGSTQEQIFLFAYGLGANGKSVFSDIIRHVMGDYARAIAVETLTAPKRQAGAATPDLVDLVGARLAVCSETEDGAALAESLVKSLVGGDVMSVRKLHGSPFQFTPQLKLMMLGNHKPIIHGNDDGIWRRVRLIPFNRTFTEKERDPALQAKLRAEAPHILAWMVEGCLNWQLLGLLDTPASVRLATDGYRSEQDLIGRWLTEHCEQSQSHETTSQDLYRSYQGWCATNGLRAATNVSLGRRLAERGFKSRKSRGQSVWIGIRIIADVFFSAVA